MAYVCEKIKVRVKRKKNRLRNPNEYFISRKSIKRKKIEFRGREQRIYGYKKGEGIINQQWHPCEATAHRESQWHKV